MKYLSWLASIATKWVDRLEALWIFALFSIAPLAAALAEPRTIMFFGYTGDARAAFAMCLVMCIGLVTGFGLSTRTSPISTGLGIATAAVSLVALLSGANSFPWASGLVLLILSQVFRVLSTRWERLRIASPRCLWVGLCMATLGLADFCHEYLLTGVDLRGVTAAILSRLYPTITSASQPPSVSAVSDGHTMVIQIALDRMGGVYLVTLAFLVLLASAWRKRPILSIIVDLGVLGLYAVVMSYVTILRNSGLDEHNWFSEWYWPVAFAPFSAWYVVRLLGTQTSEANKKRWARPWAWAASLSGAFMVAVGWCLWGPSMPHKGRVVMDEAHGAWETAQIPLQSNVFGAYTVYNYRSWFEELQRRYGAELAMHELTPDELKDVSVLILKTPTKPFSDAFRNAVVDYVHRGGGLWLIGDHTDAFGMTTYLNRIAVPLGIEFQKNAWFEPPTKRNLWEPNIFTDPVAAKLTTFLFYTGCEVKVPPLDRRLMVGRREMLENADYSAGSFFGPLRLVPENNGGNVAMATLGERDKGRVAVWTDSTLFSNFAIYTPGKLEVSLNIMEWLRRSNSLPDFRALMIFAGVAVFLIGALCSVDSLSTFVAGVMAVALCPLLIRLNGFAAHAYEPAEVIPRESVAFFDPIKSPHLPIYVSIDKAEEYGYLSSFVAVQRIGLRPYVAQSFSETDHAKTIVLIPLLRVFPKEDVAALGAWVRGGGHLIVLDGCNDGGVLLIQIFKAAGVVPPIDGQKVNPANDKLVDSGGHGLGTRYFLPLKDWKSAEILTADKHTVVGAWYPAGSGKIFATSTVDAFNDQSCGYVLELPNSEQFAALAALYSIYRESEKP